MSNDKATKRPVFQYRMQQSADGKLLGIILEAENGDRIGWINHANFETGKGDGPPYIDSEKYAALIVKAVNLHDELVECLERFLAYGNVFSHRKWESNPYDTAMNLLARAGDRLHGRGDGKCRGYPLDRAASEVGGED